MPTSTLTNASTAVRGALNRAKAHAGTAAIAALLSPLAATPALAAPFSDISGSASTVSGVTTFTYRVTSSAFLSVFQFELPELHSNDFDLGSFSGPSGWTVVENSTPAFASTGFKAGGPTPGAYLFFQTQTNGISEGFADFSLATRVNGFTNANFTTQLGFASNGFFFPASTETIDPIVPGVAATAVVPEPPVTALMFGGLAAALAVARRRKA